MLPAAPVWSREKQANIEYCVVNDRADPELLVFEIGDALERVAEHGDLFAAVLTTRQSLD